MKSLDGVNKKNDVKFDVNDVGGNLNRKLTFLFHSIFSCIFNYIQILILSQSAANALSHVIYRILFRVDSARINIS